MSDAWDWAGEAVSDTGDYLFGNGDDTGLLGTGQRRMDPYDVNKDSFTNRDSEANQADIANRRAGIDARQAQTMGSTQVAANERAGTAQAGPTERGTLTTAGNTNIARGEDTEMRAYQQALANQLMNQTQGKGPAFDLANNSYRQANEQAVKNMMGVLAANGGAVNPAMAQRALLDAQTNIETQNAQALANDKLRAQMAAQQQLGGVVTGARSQDIGVNTDQANLYQQTALANMGAANDMSKFNAGQGNTLNLENARLRQQTNLFNAGETNDANALQAQLDFQQKQANLEAYYKNQGMNDEMVRYYTDRQMQLDEADRAAQMAYEQLKVEQDTGINAIESKDYEQAAQRKAGTAGGIAEAGMSLISASDVNSKQNVYSVSSEKEKTQVKRADGSNFTDAEVKAAMEWKKRMDAMKQQRDADNKPGVSPHVRMGHAIGQMFAMPAVALSKGKSTDAVLAAQQKPNVPKADPSVAMPPANPASTNVYAPGQPAPPPEINLDEDSGEMFGGRHPNFVPDQGAIDLDASTMRDGASDPRVNSFDASFHRDSPTDQAAVKRNVEDEAGREADRIMAGYRRSLAAPPAVSLSSFDMKTGIMPALGSMGNINNSGNPAGDVQFRDGGMDVMGTLRSINGGIMDATRSPAGGGMKSGPLGGMMSMSDERAKKDAFEAGVLYADASSAQRSGHKVDDKHLELPAYMQAPKKSADSGAAIRAVDRDEPGKFSPAASTSPLQKIPDETSPTGWRYAQPMVDGAPNRTSQQASPTFAAQQQQAVSDKQFEERPFFDQNFMQQYVDEPTVRAFADFMAPLAAGPIGGAVYGIRRTQRDQANNQRDKAVSASDERIKTGVSEADAEAFGGGSSSLGDQSFTGSYQDKQEKTGFAPSMEPKTTTSTNSIGSYGTGYGGTQDGQDPWVRRASYIDNLRQQQAPAAPGSGEVARYGGSTMRPQRDAMIDRQHADQVAGYQRQLASLGQQLQQALAAAREADARARASQVVQPIVQQQPAPTPAPTSADIPAAGNTVTYGGAASNVLPGSTAWVPDQTYTAGSRTSPMMSSMGQGSGYQSSNTGLPGALGPATPIPSPTDSIYKTYSSPLSSTLASTNTRFALSDKRQKHNIEDLNDEVLDSFLEKIQAYTYDYKNPDAPGAGHGRQLGVMAQDLERSPIGKSAVKNVNGTKMVDYGKLGGITLAGLSMVDKRQQSQDERITNLEKALELASKRKGR